MSQLEFNIKDLFAKGQYQKIAEICESEQDISSLELQVGSLCFMGRLDEAQLHYQNNLENLNRSQVIACRFFLSIGFTRHSQQKEAVKLLSRNLKELKNDTSPMDQFYIYQGLAFHRNMGCRYNLSLRSAHLAWKAAVSANFLWGRVLASDLKGHSLILTGQLNLGIKSLNDANRIANRIGNDALATATTYSIATANAAAGIDPHGTLDALVNKLETLDPQDNYSRPGLLLELSRELALRGRLRESDHYLNEASKLIYASQHKRYESLLNFRLAYNAYLKGQFSRSHKSLDEAERSLDPKFNLDLKIKLLGLRVDLNKKEGQEPNLDLTTELDRLVRYTGYGLGKRSQTRQSIGNWHHQIGDDPVGDLIDRFRSPKITKVQKIEDILKQGYLSFLPEILGISPTERCIVLDPIPNTLVIIDQGNLRVYHKSLTPAMRLCLKALANQRTSKEELIEDVWGYSYDPLRHDPLIYGLMGRIRNSLAEYASWIAATEGAYQIEDEVKVYFLGSKVSAEQSHAAVVEGSGDFDPAKEESSPFVEYEDFDLNLRQLKFLATMKISDFYTVAEYQALFPEVSRITASRDLSSLVKHNLLKRAGKARATSYYRTSMA